MKIWPTAVLGLEGSVSENGLLIAEFVLIDTDILIDVGLGIEVARAHLERLEQTMNLAVSAVTQMELIVGCRNKRELGVLFQFLTQFQLVGLSARLQIC